MSDGVGRGPNDSANARVRRELDDGCCPLSQSERTIEQEIRIVSILSSRDQFMLCDGECSRRIGPILLVRARASTERLGQ